MSAVLKQKGKQGGWTPEKRLEQSRIMREKKIWLKSTGPQTFDGKAKSSQNALKHGRFSAESKSIRTWLCFVSRNLKFIKATLRHHAAYGQISKNELGNSQQETRGKTVHNEISKSNILPFQGPPPT